MATSPASKAPLPLPAVIDLGRRIAALSAEYDRHEQASLDARGNARAQLVAHNTMKILDEQSQVLRDLVTTIPARSMADAAVQIAEAFGIAEDLYRNVHSSVEVERLAAALTRLALSALPVIAAAAGLDPAAMGWESEVGYLYASRFAGLEGVA
ncbi:MAG: hypothetical protein ACRYHQ_34320 [Janthinobacterium lividum]